MARLALFILALGLLAWLAARGMQSSGASGTERPTVQLQNAKGAAKRMERQQEQRANEALQRSQEALGQ